MEASLFYADRVCGLFAFFHCDASCGLNFLRCEIYFSLRNVFCMEIHMCQLSILNLFFAVEILNTNVLKLFLKNSEDTFVKKKITSSVSSAENESSERCFSSRRK